MSYTKIILQALIYLYPSEFRTFKEKQNQKPKERDTIYKANNKVYTERHHKQTEVRPVAVFSTQSPFQTPIVPAEIWALGLHTFVSVFHSERGREKKYQAKRDNKDKCTGKAK